MLFLYLAYRVQIIIKNLNFQTSQQSFFSASLLLLNLLKTEKNFAPFSTPTDTIWKNMNTGTILKNKSHTQANQ